MKALVLGFAAGFALAFASAGAALAQDTPYSATYTTYYDTVAASNCVGSTFCKFTFAAVPTFTTSNGGVGELIVSHVNCRIVVFNILPPSLIGTPIPLVYAALGKTSNASKLFFLTGSNGVYPTGVNDSTDLIDQTAQLFVQAGASPTITIALGWGPLSQGGIDAPNPAVDEPTCSVSGLIE
jgi:hypothetical protein